MVTKFVFFIAIVTFVVMFRPYWSEHGVLNFMIRRKSLLANLLTYLVNSYKKFLQISWKLHLVNSLSFVCDIPYYDLRKKLLKMGKKWATLSDSLGHGDLRSIYINVSFIFHVQINIRYNEN